MWSKTSAALIAGCFISVSLMLNMNYLLPLETDTLLLSGLIIGFPIWAVTMVYCYASTTGLQAWKRCLIPLSLSVLLNVIFFTG